MARSKPQSGKTLPYSLTGSQETALAEISADMEKPERMLRLLQGDVGSGKTVVALLAMVRAAEAGGQSALMAPTEVLARQHFATIRPLAEKAGLKTMILTGREKGRERADILAALADGSAAFVIGTHALFQDAVDYHDLALAIVDEQHRFGVHQRLAITAKGDAPDMLVMTATPIPRTLVLTAFGDMDVSKLTEKPAGRRPIATITLPFERMDDLVERIRRRDPRRSKGLLDLPAGRGIRRGQADLGRRTLCDAAGRTRACRRTCARPHEGAGKRRRDARLQGR
jgi:ATP-dependent DNA helicase RecG